MVARKVAGELRKRMRAQRGVTQYSQGYRDGLEYAIGMIEGYASARGRYNARMRDLRAQHPEWARIVVRKEYVRAGE